MLIWGRNILLRLEKVNTYYDDVHALRDISFGVTRGDVVSIIGANGAGKSTILNTISGILRCSSGRIEFLGKRIDHLFSHQIVDLGLVQVPEGRLLFPYMTVLENLELGAFNLRARREREKNLQLSFGLFPVLQERKKQLAGTLSGGEQQMLAIGRGIMAVPELLMLDEPSLGLAPMMVKEVFEIVQEIKAKSITVLLVEQNVFHSLSAATKAYALENGTVTLGGEGKELLNNPRVREAYLGI
jgi:branched-chain amino acid transport system ATP-binding protein